MIFVTSFIHTALNNAQKPIIIFVELAKTFGKLLVILSNSGLKAGKDYLTTKSTYSNGTKFTKGFRIEIPKGSFVGSDQFR